MSNKELKRCPFCGGEAKLWTTKDSFDSNGWYSEVICQHCNARTTGDEDEAINKWNTRNYNKECCEKSCKEENATLKPLVPKWADIGGGRYYLEVSIMQAVKIIFEIKYDTEEEPLLYTLKAFLSIWERDWDYEEEGGVFNNLEEAKEKANECIKELGERLVYFSNKIKTNEESES